ncbi:hypothetical protein ACIPPQ_21605 [Sphingopyxis sp. LARHCG72]
MSRNESRSERRQGVASPYSKVPVNRRFRTLDEYLAFLKEMSTLDMPWWEEISPGVYRRVTGLLAQLDGPEIATRAELMKRYGFDR